MSEPLFNRQGEERKPTRIWNGKPQYVTRQLCSRCGGAGGSDKWKHTGWTCYRCGGNRWDPNPLIEKLYTAEQNAKLDGIAAKKLAAKLAKRAAAAEVERLRQIAERAEIISQNSDIIARIEAELAHGEVEILRSVLDRITQSAKDPTERQVEVVEQIIARNAAERERLLTVGHVGAIKERRDFTLTLLYCRSELIDQFPTIWSHWSLFTDENGCKIACKSAPWVLGLKHERDEPYTKGQVIRVKATVTEHRFDKKNEPVTYINRPKQIEEAKAA